MTPRISLLTLAAALSSSSPSDAFTSVAVRAPKHYLTRSSPLTLQALIYGWDGGDAGQDASSSPYLDIASDLGQSCSPVGTAVAEALSYDSQRAGHLARLAVAFSPPERALALDRIERVDVVCVRDDHIEIEAIVCEDGGCVSLSVPVKFPRDCHSSESSALVMRPSFCNTVRMRRSVASRSRAMKDSALLGRMLRRSYAEVRIRPTRIQSIARKSDQDCFHRDQVPQGRKP